MTETGNHPKEDPIESWKEIATYLKRDVRTVKRWEKREGLPVHRQMHQARSSVYAYPSELEAWKIDREPRLNAPPVITPWRRAVSAVGFAAVMLLALVTMASGPIQNSVLAATDAEGSGAVFRQVKFEGSGGIPFAQLSPDGKKMLYVDINNKTNQSSLRIVNLVSGAKRTLIADYGEKMPWNCFRWSPDGSKVVYADNERRQLRIIGSNGGASQPLWSSPGSTDLVQPLDWSRDGSRVLAAAVNDMSWTIRFAVVPVGGGKPRFVIAGKSSDLDGGQFSPDGRFIAGRQREGGKKGHISVWAADNGREISRVEGMGNCMLPYWSPDAKYLVFISDRLKSLDLWALAMSEGRPVGAPFRVKQNLGRNTLLTGFTPAGQLTMLVTGEGTPPDLFVLHVDPSTGEARGKFAPLAKYPTDAFSPRWSPDGRRVAYTSRKGQIRLPSIFVNSIDGEEELEIPPGGSYVVNVEWSPDGKNLLFPAIRDNGDVGIFRISLSNHEIKPLHLGGRRGPGFKGGFVNLQWLPRAGKFIFAKLADNGHKDIYTIDRKGRQVQLVAENLPTPYFTWPSPDGRQIAYRQGQDLKLLNLAEKTSVTLATIPAGSAVSGPAWSPDAHQIAYTDTRQLKVSSSTGGAAKVLVDTCKDCKIGGTSWWSGISWSPDGSTIAYLSRTTLEEKAARSELWVIPAADGNPRRIAVAPAGHPLLSDVVWHPDGTMIIATGEAPASQKRGYEHWLMEDFLPKTVASK